MPTEEENIQYLYLVLTHGGPPQVDWPPIHTALSLKPGATSKRWSRLKTALEAGKPAGAGAYQLLWLMMKHSTRDKALDWKAIASACGTTVGAASKRYSRMKAAFEAGDDAGPPPALPKKGGGSITTTKTTSATAEKRKRGSGQGVGSTPGKKKKTTKDGGEGGKFAPDSDDGEEDEDEYEASPKKRVRKSGGGGTNARAKDKTKTQTSIKAEPDADENAELDTAIPFKGFHNRNGHRHQDGDQHQQHTFQGFKQEGLQHGNCVDENFAEEEWHESREFLPHSAEGAEEYEDEYEEGVHESEFI